MTPKLNLEEYNKMCAEFLGFEISENEECFKVPNKNGWVKLTIFYSDWNWIMEVIQKILKIRLKLKDYHVVEWFEVYFYSKGCLIRSGLKHADGETVSPYYYQRSVWKPNSKDAVVESVWQFLHWYNQHKI